MTKNPHKSQYLSYVKELEKVTKRVEALSMYRVSNQNDGKRQSMHEVLKTATTPELP
jgi:hypothetical protein